MQPMSSLRRTCALICAALLLTAIPALPGRSSSDTATRWNSFSESSTCGAPFTRTPYASKTGGLSASEPVPGPFGSYFGRTMAQVRANLVPWTVPGSGGQMVWVHFRALPAFQRVASALAVEARQGRVYPIRDVSAFFSRTIAGSQQMSRHGLGLAIDINPTQNPQTRDRLVTNMPGWFVDIWREAGFCWGGDWASSKDAMHFSWMGPASGPEAPLKSFAPVTGRRAYGPASDRYRTEFASVVDRYRITIADVTGKGAPDVAGVRPHPGGSVIDVASGTWLYGACSVNRWFVPEPALARADRVLFMDMDGDSGQDLVAFGGDPPVTATFATRSSDFEDISTITTGLDPASAALAGADFDGDRRADLWEARPGGGLRILGGPQFASGLANFDLPAGTPLHIAAGDRDAGNRPELFALYPKGPGSRISVIQLEGGAVVEQNLDISVPAAQVRGLGAADYDGDGRADIQILTAGGGLNIHIGNTSTGIPATRWFARPDQNCTNPDRLVVNGLFFDDEASIFEGAIDRLGASEVTRGCNPPFNDRFCPEDPVTRGQMAAFLVRALGYSNDGGGDRFSDDDNSVFEAAIDRLATAGVTLGCNPPANTNFCPDQPVTRGQMAAFLIRALDL